MPSRRTLEAGNAVITLSLNDKVSAGLKKFQSKLKTIGSQFQVVGSRISAVGGIITGAFAAATKVFIETGDQLKDMSTRTGFAVESLGKLAYAAGQSGTSLEAVEKGARGMARLLLGASQGAAASVETLDALGLTLDSLEGKSPDEQFRRLAGAIANVQDPTRRAALAMKAFGKSGAELLPMLANGEAGMEAMFREAERLGLVMSEKDATAAAELDDAMNKLSSQFKGVAVQVGSAVAGPLKQFGEKLSEIVNVSLQFSRVHPELIKGIGAIGVSAIAAGGLVAGLGTALTLVSAHPIIFGLTLIGTTVAGLYIYFDEITAKTKAWHNALENLFPEGSFLDIFAKLLKIRDLQMEIEKNRPKVEGPQFVNDEGQVVGGSDGHFSNGETIGGEKGFFSNGESWDDITAREARENVANRDVPFANQPSIDPIQGPLAALGLNKHALGDKGGNMFLDAFDLAREALVDKVKLAAAKVEFEWGPTVQAAMDKVNAAIEGTKAVMVESSVGGKAIATLDTSFAQQQFGRGSSREVDLLTQIAESTRVTADKLKQMKPLKAGRT